MSPPDKKGVSGSKLPQAPKRHHDETETADQLKESLNDAAHRERSSHVEKKRRRLESRIAAQEQHKRASTASHSSATNQYQSASQSVSRSSDDEARTVNIGHSLPPSQSISPKLAAGLRSGSVVSSFHIFDMFLNLSTRPSILPYETYGWGHSAP
jgi:TFIIF-interacting CTD phosphatase-like protein